MISISELSPQTQATVRRMMVELHWRPVKPNNRSLLIKLGNKTPVLINPTIKDTDNNISDMDNTLDFKTKKSKSEKVVP